MPQTTSLHGANGAPHRSLHRAVDDVVTSGQQLLLDRVELMALDARWWAQRAFARVALVGISLFCGLCALIVGSVGLVQVLSLYMMPWAATLTVAAAYAVLGIVGALIAAFALPAAPSDPQPTGGPTWTRSP